MTESKAELITRDLAGKIHHNQYQPGTFLPSENELIELYGASRGTVRKALDTLMNLGLIQKIKGKGSIVLKLDRYAFPISGITSFQELNRALGMDASTDVVTFETCQTIPEPLASRFEQYQDQPGYYVERLRTIDGQPEVLDCDYLFNPPITGLTKEIAAHSFYDYIENDLNLTISYATKEITVENIAPQHQQRLQLPSPTAVLVTSANYLDDTTIFQLTISYHNPAKFKFTDFARRQKISF